MFLRDRAPKVTSKNWQPNGKDIFSITDTLNLDVCSSRCNVGSPSLLLSMWHLPRCVKKQPKGGKAKQENIHYLVHFRYGCPSGRLFEVNISCLKWASISRKTDWFWSASPPTGCVCPKILWVLIKADWAVFIQSIRPSNQPLRRLKSLIYPKTISTSILFRIFLESLSDYIFIPLKFSCSIFGTVCIFILSGRRLICWCR